MAAGRRILGMFLLVLFGSVAAFGLWLATAGRRTALRWSVDPAALLAISVGIALLAGVWAVTVIASHQVLRPRRQADWQRAAGWGLVAVLTAAITIPAAFAVNLAATQRTLVQTVFAEDGRSATVVAAAAPAAAPAKARPFANQPRLNILLLGGDGGAGRDGVRTDTVIVASIDTVSGATTLFSLPRNLEKLPFPADSPLGAFYPNGFRSGPEDESLLNAVYRNGPADHPDALGPTDNPGADFLKLGVGEALGLHIDYYALVNLDGFSAIVDSLGGVDVNVNGYVPVGGEPSTGRLPDAYIAPGPDQHMDGETALAYARGRFGSSDYQRMARQRCLVGTIAAAADPVTLVTRYGQLAAATKDIIVTDIPRSVLPDLADLGLVVKGAQIRSIVFDNTVITPADPDYDEIRALVSQALATPPVSAASAAPVGGTGTGTDTPSATATTTRAAPGASATSSGSAAAEPITDVSDVCAYDPVAAQAALDAGEPPTYRG